MTLIELAGCVFGVAVGLIGAWYGSSMYGPFGAAAGFVLGVLFGWAMGVGIVGLGFYVGITKERFEQRNLLKKLFGAYWVRGRSEAWDDLVQSLEPGVELSGAVVVKFHYGAFVDTGHGFPALLGALHFDDQEEFSLIAIGTQVSSRLRGFDHHGRFMELTQHVSAPAQFSNTDSEQAGSSKECCVPAGRQEGEG